MTWVSAGSTNYKQLDKQNSSTKSNLNLANHNNRLTQNGSRKNLDQKVNWRKCTQNKLHESCPAANFNLLSPRLYRLKYLYSAEGTEWELKRYLEHSAELCVDINCIWWIISLDFSSSSGMFPFFITRFIRTVARK